MVKEKGSTEMSILSLPTSIGVVVGMFLTVVNINFLIPTIICGIGNLAINYYIKNEWDKE